MSLTTLAAFITEIGVLIGAIKWISSKVKNSAKGVMCLLRTDMLQIYYKNKDVEKIRQYDYENFIMLYESYKSLGGNSFIDKIYSEVKTWEITT